MGWLKEHSLGLFCLTFMIGGFGYAVLDGVEGQDIALNVGADAFGAAIVVLGSKWFRERGSTESK